MTNWGHLWNLTHGRYLNIRDLGYVSEMRELQFSSVLLSSLTTHGKLTGSKLETLDAFTQASISQPITSLEGPTPLPCPCHHGLHHRYPSSPGLVAALTWPASLLSVANVIDNPWGVCLHRSAEVGKHLAHILLSRQQVPGNSWGREWGERAGGEEAGKHGG